MIPVQIDVTGMAVFAECTKCGKCTRQAVSGDREDGTLAARKKAAKAAALAALTEQCEERMPWHVPPAHEERHAPRGVALYCEGANKELLPVMVNLGTAAGKLVVVVRQGKLELPHVGVPMDAVVLVVPEGEKFRDAAIEFAKALTKRGYKRAQFRESAARAA